MGNEMEEFSIGAMLPVTPINSDQRGNDLSDTSVEDMIDKNNKEFSKANSLESGIDGIFNSLDLTTKIDEEEKEDIPVIEGYCFFDPDEDIFSESTKDIDEDIKEVIDTLNKKGYITKYSCSGHPSGRFKKDVFRDGVLHKKLYSTARVVFAKDYDFPSIPKYWELKVLDEDKSAIYVKPPTYKITNGLPKDAFTKWKAKYMNSLRTWVDKLPNQGEEPEQKESKDVTVESVIDDILISTF